MNLIRVLLIDDDSTARQGITTYLQDVAEFDVIEAQNGDQALRHLKNQADTYTVVLLDFVLGPPMNGNQVLAEIRRLYPRLPVIVFTGQDPYGGVQTLEKGAYRYLRRPLDLVELVNTIRNLAEQDTKFREMAADIRNMLDSDLSIAWQLDKKKGHFYVAAWDGELDETYRKTVFLDAETIRKSQLIQRGEPIFIPDVTNHQEAPAYLYREEAQKRGWTSLICVPLVHHQRIIGFVDSYTYQPFEFHGHQRLIISSLRAFAHQAAETIRNIELSNRLETLQDINQLLTGIFDEQTILRQILAKSVELVGAELGHIYLIDINRGCLVRKEWIGILATQIPPTHELGKGLTSTVAETGRAENIPDVSEDPHHTPIPGVPINSKVAVPLRREEQIIGVLSVKSRFYNAFTDDDVNLLIALATQGTIAIERARLNRHLQEVSRLALGGDYMALLNYVVEAVRDLTFADVNLWMIGGRRDGRGQFLQIVASKGHIDEEFKQKARVPLNSKKSINALALELGQPIVRQDVLNDSKTPKFYHFEQAKKQDWRSFMAVPLLVRDDNRLGMLSLYSKTVGKFGQPEIELMQTFANQAAMALQQQKITFALQQLAQVGQTLSESMTDQPKRLLKQVADVARRLTRADCIVIYPYDPIKKRFYEKESIAAIGIQYALQDVTDKPRETGLAASIRQVGTIVAHDIAQNDVEIALETTNQQGIERQDILSTIHEAKFIQREGIKAFVGVSLRANERVDGQQNQAEEVGILYFNFRTPHHFNHEELQIIKIFAHQVANIIRGARLYTEAQRQNRELEAVNQTALKIVAQEEDVNSLLEALVEEATNLLKAKGGKVYLRVPNQNKIELVAQKNVDASLLPLRSRLLFGKGVAGAVFVSKEPLIIDDYAKCEWCVETLAHLFTAIIEVPLLLKDEAIGVLCVFDDAEKRKFTEQDIPILERLAQQASLAIHNATLFDKSQKRLLVLDALHETSLDIVQRLEFDKLMPAIIDRASKLIAGKNSKYKGIGAAYLRCDYRNEIIVIDYSTNKAFKNTRLNFDEGIVGQVIRTGKAKYINDFPHSANYLPVFDENNLSKFMKNVICVPVKQENKIVALIVISEAHGKRVFNDDDIELLERFADLAAIAIQNARLVDNAQRRIRDLEIINHIVETISTQLNPDEVIETMISLIAKQLDCTHCAFFSPENEEGELVLVPKVTQGTHAEQINRLNFKIGEGIAGWVFELGESRLLNEAQKHAKFAPARRIGEYEPRSLLVVPVKKGEQTIGIICADQDVEGWFSQYDKQLLETLARHASIAIERATLFERIRTQREAQTRAIHEIANSIPTQKPSKEILESLLDWTLSLMDEASLGEIRLLDEKTNELVVQASRGELLKEHHRLPVGKGITGWVALHKTSLLIGNVHKDKRYVVGLEESCSELAVAMLRENKLIGVLNIEHPELNAFTPEDVKLAEAIAGLAVVAIENNRLFEELRDRATRLEHLQTVTTTISAEPSDLENVLRLIVDSLSYIFDSYPCMIRLYDANKNKFTHKVAQTTVVSKEQTLDTPRSNGISRYVLKTKEPYYVEDSDHIPPRGTPTIRETIVAQGVRAMAALPLLSENEGIGVLYLNLKRPHQFTPNDEQILKLFANQAVVPIKNAQLYEQIRAQREAQIEAREAQIEAIGKITRSISIATLGEPKEVLGEIMNSMVTLMGRAHLFLVTVLDKNTDELVRVASQGEIVSESPLRIKMGKGVTGWVAQHKKPLILPDVSQYPDYLPGLKEARSELAVPMLKGDELVGVLNIEHPELDAFKEEDVKLAQAIAGLAVVALENNRLQEAQEKAMAAEKLAVMGHVTAEFVHRMNNLVGTIPVRVNMAKAYLDRKEPKDAKVMKQLERIGRDTHLLLQAVQQLKRTTEARTPEHLVLNDLIQPALKRVWFEQAEAKAGIDVVKRLSSSLPTVYVDRKLLFDTLLSISRNAIQAMPEGGTLTLTTRKSIFKGKACVELLIKDNGVGIPNHDLASIFDLFFTTKERGLGFGLWRDKTFIKMLGGDIEVESVFGQGSTFTIKLPVVS